MSNLFNSIFTMQPQLQVPQLMLAYWSACFLGLALTLTYKYRTSTPENLSSV